MIKENKITSLSKILLISIIVILLLGGTLIYYYSTTITKVTETTTITETKTITTTIFLDTDGDGIPNYKEKEYGTDPNKPNYLLAYALKKLPEQEALKFKNVENFNESSKTFVDYYVSLPENVRISKEVNELLNQILSDNIIDELEKNLFYDKFVFPNLPLIFNLEWITTREKLDKIYDINVTFVAKDDNTPIAYAELHFVPVEYYYMIENYGMRQEDYPKVFPPDNERIYVLTPINGKFDSLEERFSVSINDIVGGREYKIVVLIRDLAGNERKAEIKTPYIRQFENLGRELYERGIIISADYYPLYPDPHPWEKLEPMAAHPMLGKYDVTDPIIIFKQIDTATGHGINCFNIAWHFDWVMNNKEVLYKVKRNVESFLQNSLSSQIHFFLGYDPTSIKGEKVGWTIELKDPLQWKKVLEEMELLNSWGIFDHPQYLRVNGKPVMYFLEAQSLIGKVDEMLRDISSIRKIFWIGDVVYTLSEPAKYDFELVKIASYDAWSDWLGSWYIPLKEPVTVNFVKALEEAHKKWGSKAREYGITYVPTVTPGFINLRDPSTHILPRDAEMFKKEVEIALKYATKTADGKRILINCETK
jgi:hypothetical protein